MKSSSKPRPSLPIVRAFLICREVFRDQRGGEFILVGPMSHVPVNQFPCRIGVNAFLQLVEANGQYQFSACLKDADDEIVWHWRANQPFRHPEPLIHHHVVFHDWILSVPHAGRYHREVAANDEELCTQALLIGPQEMFLHPE